MDLAFPKDQALHSIERATAALKRIESVPRCVFHRRVEQGEEVFGIDCRPSDGIALSLRGAADIYVTEKVWDQAAEG